MAATSKRRLLKTTLSMAAVKSDDNKNEVHFAWLRIRTVMHLLLSYNQHLKLWCSHYLRLVKTLSINKKPK